MKNYKTTVLGLIGAIWLAIQPLIATGTFSLSRDWKNLVGAAIVAAMGFLVKDFNVTGGTIPNTTNDASVVKDTAKKDA